EDKNIITRSVRFENGGNQLLNLNRLMSATVDYRDSEYDLVYFPGRHMMEREFERTPIRSGLHSIGSSRGTSSHQYNPFAIVCERDAGEDHGGFWGYSLVYS